MNVALYLRVSTADQFVESQRLELVAHVKHRGWTATHEFTDTASGAKADRPGLAKLMTLVASRGVDAVLCVKLDRMARSLSNFAQLVELFEKADVALICTSQSIDTSKSNACGRLQMAVLAAVAEFERELIRERTRAGLAVARAAGKVLGKVSTVMPAPSVRLQIVTDWHVAGAPGGYPELARRLGGINRGTAMRVAKKLLQVKNIPELVIE